MNNSFQQDLKLGEKAERFILERLKTEFPSLKKEEGYNPDYDLIDENGYTIEVKFDEKSKETGNVGIEYKNRNKPSAISVSPAMEWIIIYYGEGWKYTRIKTEELRAFIKNNWEFLDKIKGSGDKSSLVLIPVSTLEQYFTYFEIND